MCFFLAPSHSPRPKSDFLPHPDRKFRTAAPAGDVLATGGSDGKESAYRAGDIRDMSLIPGSGRSPGEGNGNPLQCSCLGNPMDRGAWQAMIQRAAESQTWLKWPSRHPHCRRPGFDPWIGKIPCKREWQPTPVFLPGEFHGQKSLAGYSPWGHEVWDTTERLTLLLFNKAVMDFTGLHSMIHLTHLKTEPQKAVFPPRLEIPAHASLMYGLGRVNSVSWASRQTDWLLSWGPRTRVRAQESLGAALAASHVVFNTNCSSLWLCLAPLGIPEALDHLSILCSNSSIQGQGSSIPPPLLVFNNSTDEPGWGNSPSFTCYMPLKISPSHWQRIWENVSP